MVKSPGRNLQESEHSEADESESLQPDRRFLHRAVEKNSLDTVTPGTLRWKSPGKPLQLSGPGDVVQAEEEEAEEEEADPSQPSRMVRGQFQFQFYR